jgi:hypothetical protein
MEAVACDSLVFRSYSACTSLVHACEPQSLFSVSTELRPALKELVWLLFKGNRIFPRIVMAGGRMKDEI